MTPKGVNTSDGFVKISEMIANPIIKVYKAGQLGLVFIFLGLLLVIFAQLNYDSKYSVWTFVLGIALILLSFFLFLFLQLKNPLTKQSNLKKGKEVVDTLQELSINLTKLTGKLQTFSFKYVHQIDDSLKVLYPIIQKVPFLPENVKTEAIKVQDVQAKIVEVANDSEKIIKEIEQALIKSDVDKLKGYVTQVEQLIATINDNLKK